MFNNRALLVLISAAAIAAISNGIRQANGLFLYPITTDLSVGREVFGFATALGFLVFGLILPFVGLFSDRHGPEKVLFAGGVLYAAGLALMAVAESPFGLYVSLGLFIGLAFGMTGYTIVLSAISRAVAPERRGFAMGIATATSSFGMFAFIPITQLLMTGMGWSGALYVLAAIALLMCVMGFGVRMQPAEHAAAADEDQSLGAALREAGRHRGYWLLTVGYFVCGFHVAFIGTHLPAFLRDGGIAPNVAATAFALIGLVNIASSMFFGAMGDRFRKKYLLCGIYLARAALFTLILVVPLTETTAIVFCMLMGLLWLGTVPLTNGLVAQIFGLRYLATLAGIVFMSHQIGSFAGSWLGGWIYDATGSYDAIWYIAIALGLIAVLMHWPIADSPVHRPRAAEA